MTATMKLLGAKPAGGAFDPIADVGWLELFWAEGTDFVAEGYSDTDAVDAWPSEVSTLTTAYPVGAASTFDDSVAALGGNPAVLFGGGGIATTTFPNLSQPYSLVVVAIPPTGQTTFVSNNGTGAAARSWFTAGTGDDVWINAGGASLQANAVLSVGQAFLAVAYYNGASSVIEVDGTVEASGNAGTGALNEPWQGSYYTGYIALIGVYNGDVRSDGGWSGFESWVSSHYGVTIA